MFSKSVLLGVLFGVILLPSLVLASPSQDYRINFSEKAISSDKTGTGDVDRAEEEIFKYTPPSQPKYEFNLLGLLLKTILALGIITAAIYFTLRVFFRGRNLTRLGGDLFRVIGTQALAPNKYLQLVEIGNVLVLLGITENGINLLTEINDRETIDLIKTQASRVQTTEGMSFPYHLKEFLKGFRRQELFDETLMREKKVTFLKDQRAKLRKLGQMNDDR